MNNGIGPFWAQVVLPFRWAVVSAALIHDRVWVCTVVPKRRLYIDARKYVQRRVRSIASLYVCIRVRTWKERVQKAAYVVLFLSVCICAWLGPCRLKYINCLAHNIPWVSSLKWCVHANAECPKRSLYILEGFMYKAGDINKTHSFQCYNHENEHT